MESDTHLPSWGIVPGPKSDSAIFTDSLCSRAIMILIYSHKMSCIHTDQHTDRTENIY